MSPWTFRFARPDERLMLEELQRRASLAYAETREHLLANPDVIELPLAQLVARQVRVAEQGGAVLGFSAVLPRAPGIFDLDGLFVEPDRWRRGIGRALMGDALAQLPAHAHLHVLANPRAEAFYARLGFVPFEIAQTLLGPAHRMRLVSP